MYNITYIWAFIFHYECKLYVYLANISDYIQLYDLIDGFFLEAFNHILLSKSTREDPLRCVWKGNVRLKDFIFTKNLAIVYRTSTA